MTERQNVTWAVYVLALLMLVMAFFQPDLWEVELFKVLLQAVIISGFINMILAFHFAANKSDEQKTDNTAKAFDAIKATANAAGPTDPARRAAEQVAGAAVDEAGRIKGEQ